MPSQNKQRKVFWAIMCRKSTPRKSWERCTASFLSKADLIHVVPRCNNSKNPLFCDTRHVQRVIPTRCASKKELFVKIQILFPLHAQTTQWFIWQAPKWEMQIGKECARCRARAEQISRKKRLPWKVRNRLNLKAERSLWWQRQKHSGRNLCHVILPRMRCSSLIYSISDVHMHQTRDSVKEWIALCISMYAVNQTVRPWGAFT